MSLIGTLRAPAVNSILAAGLGMLGTLVMVWFAGPEVFAHYAIDLARLALIGLILEVIPSAYAIYHIQRDLQFRAALRAFSGLGSLMLMLATLGLATAGVFSAFSGWIVAYVAYLPAQRYVDTALQADGQLARYFSLIMAVNALRLVLLFAGLQLWPESASDVVWASLAIASWSSIIMIYALDRSFRRGISRGTGPASLRILWDARQNYYGYYLNAGLKRIKDSLMMLICGSLVSNTTAVAQYVLLFRGIDFVGAQFRIAEAALSNYESRRKVAKSRRRDLAVLSVLGQGAAVVLSTALALQAGPLNWPLLAAIGIASFVLYPYVVEVTLRSDAYAAFQPRRVTLSIMAYIVTVAVVLLVWMPFGLDLISLVTAQVTAQCAAAAVFIFNRQPSLEKPRVTDAPD